MPDPRGALPMSIPPIGRAGPAPFARRTGTSLTAETAPILRGDGDISYVCGDRPSARAFRCYALAES